MLVTFTTTIKPHLTRKPETSAIIALKCGLNHATTEHALQWAKVRGLCGFQDQGWEDRHLPTRYCLGSS